MDNPHDIEAPGPFEDRYLAFLETITQVRPRLHRYCSRMTGSVLDGEDVVQDALFEAYRKLVRRQPSTCTLAFSHCAQSVHRLPEETWSRG
jgi:DNA-directed RNA polymerase specialized sigma24 family protein